MSPLNRSFTFTSLFTSLRSRASRELIKGFLIGFTLSVSSFTVAVLLSTLQAARRARNLRRAALESGNEDGYDGGIKTVQIKTNEIVDGVIGLIGNTPLVRINSLSDALGVEILGKAEFLNPGGSVKDRVALQIIQDAESAGLLHPHTGSTIFEGTVGSTGISLATVARAKGYETCIIMPDDVAIEKVQILEKLGAKVERVRPASIVDEKQFVNLARQRALEFGAGGGKTILSGDGKSGLNARFGGLGGIKGHEDLVVTTKAKSGPGSLAGSVPLSEIGTPKTHAVMDSIGLEERPRGFFADQFENTSNFEAHYNGTGPEIWHQTGGIIDAFVSGAGTGGTISGITTFLHSKKPDIKVVLADPEGSGLFNRVKYGVMFDFNEREGRKRRHQVDTVVEGIGINRVTKNFEMGQALINDAERITDNEAIAMSRHLVLSDGLWLGSSSACNLVACCRLAKTLPEGSTIVTILCDSGSRHQSKFWSDEYLTKNGYTISSDISDLLSS